MSFMASRDGPLMNEIVLMGQERTNLDDEAEFLQSNLELQFCSEEVTLVFSTNQISAM
jgi:hypothetical protein